MDCQRTGGGYPILVIDDHELFSTSLTMALRSAEFDARTLTVASVRDFLANSAPARASGLVVLDLDLGRDADGNWVSGVDLVEVCAHWSALLMSEGVDGSLRMHRRWLPDHRPARSTCEVQREFCGVRGPGHADWRQGRAPPSADQ